MNDDVVYLVISLVAVSRVAGGGVVAKCRVIVRTVGPFGPRAVAIGGRRGHHQTTPSLGLVLSDDLGRDVLRLHLVAVFEAVVRRRRRRHRRRHVDRRPRCKLFRLFLRRCFLLLLLLLLKLLRRVVKVGFQGA